MLLGIQQSIAVLLTIAILYAVDFTLNNPVLTPLTTPRYTIWDFTHAAQQKAALLSKTLPDFADDARRTPRFLLRLSKSR